MFLYLLSVYLVTEYPLNLFPIRPAIIVLNIQTYVVTYLQQQELSII